MPEHLREFWLFGLFFAGSGVLQAAWAGWVIARPERAALVVGAVGNAAIVALWLVTRWGVRDRLRALRPLRARR